MATARRSRPIPLPAAVQQGGRQGWIVAAIGGGAAGAITLVAPTLLSSEDAFGFLAVWPGVTAAGYLGHGLGDLVRPDAGSTRPCPGGGCRAA